MSDVDAQKKVAKAGPAAETATRPATDPGLVARLMSTAEGRRALKRRMGARRQETPEQAAEAPVSVLAPDGTPHGEIPDVPIEQVPATDAELANEAARLYGAERDREASAAQDRQVMRFQRANLERLFLDAERAVGDGIDTFYKQAATNPTTTKADREPGILATFANTAFGYLKSVAPSWLDKYAGTGGSAQLAGEDPPITDVRRFGAGVAEDAVGRVTGGLVKLSGGALDLGVGAAAGATQKIGDYLEGVHAEWVQAAMGQTLNTLTTKMTCDARRTFDLARNWLKLLSDEQLEPLLAQIDLTKPLFTAGAVSDRLEALWLEAIRPLLTANEYIDAIHGVGERKRENRRLGAQGKRDYNEDRWR